MPRWRYVLRVSLGVKVEYGVDDEDGGDLGPDAEDLWHHVAPDEAEAAKGSRLLGVERHENDGVIRVEA